MADGARPHYHLALGRHFDEDFVGQDAGIGRAPGLDIDISDGLDILFFGGANSSDDVFSGKAVIY